MFVDLRSDTVTRPTPAMRRAMAEAEVGDDGYGEDPTVNRLQERFAELVGHEAALFVPSGTMGNQICLRLLGRPGSAVLAGRRQHVVIYESGGAGVNNPAQLSTVDDTTGVLDLDELRAAIDAAEHHWLPVSAICIENTHMPSGGTPWSLAEVAAVTGLGLPVHLDGARLFNAAVATGVPAAAYGAPATTVMACLSKGLGAPVGSLIAGSADLMGLAMGERKRLGGAMRQAGVIAAAGLVALDRMIDRLADDHDRAARLAEAVADRWPGCGLDPANVRTNAVIFSPPDPRGLLRHLRDEGVLAGTIAPGVVRLMTHHDIDDAALEQARKAIATCPT
jgi:threonine aldolase